VKHVIHIPLSKVEVLQALQKALQYDFIDNLRNRHINVQLDSKLRGYIGELAFKKWMAEQGILFEQSNVKDESSGMDIDFIFKTEDSKSIEIELKTSLLPDIDETIENSFSKRDIKLIRRGHDSIEQLKGDVHVQFYFKQLRMRKDEWLKQQEVDIEKENIESLYAKLAAYRYMDDTYFMGWIDKKSLVKQLINKSKYLQKWKYGQREFWCCTI